MKQGLEQLPMQRILPKSKFGKAIVYLRNQWLGLQLYLSDSPEAFPHCKPNRSGLTE